MQRQPPALDRNRDIAPDPEPDSNTLSPSVTSIISSMVAASWGKKQMPVRSMLLYTNN